MSQLEAELMQGLCNHGQHFSLECRKCDNENKVKSALWEYVAGIAVTVIACATLFIIHQTTGLK